MEKGGRAWLDWLRRSGCEDLFSLSRVCSTRDIGLAALGQALASVDREIGFQRVLGFPDGIMLNSHANLPAKYR